MYLRYKYMVTHTHTRARKNIILYRMIQIIPKSRHIPHEKVSRKCSIAKNYNINSF